MKENEFDKILEKFAASGHRWIHFDKGRIAASIPGNPAIFQQFRHEFFSKFFEIPFEGNGPGALKLLADPMYDLRRENILSRQFRAGGTILGNLR